MASSIDGVLVEWGERLFYPGNRIVKPRPTPRLDTPLRGQAAVIRARIQATVSRRSVQVMVKVTGGGRGMAERMHERVRREFWGYAPEERFSNDDLVGEKYQPLTAAVGYIP